MDLSQALAEVTRVIGRRAFGEIIRECNLTCQHCSQSAPHVGGTTIRPISVKQFETSIAALVQSGLKRVRLTGGEPLLHPQLEDLIGIGRGFGLDVSMVTNGVLLKGRCGRLMHSGLGAVWISLYGASHDLYRSVAQRSAPVPELMCAISALHAEGVQVGLYCCLHSVRVAQDLSLVEELTAAGVDEVKFLQVMEQGRAMEQHDLSVELEPALVAIRNFGARHPTVRIAVSMRSGQAQHFARGGFIVPKYLGCVSGSPDSWAVDADGRVHPCCLFMSGSTAPAREDPLGMQTDTRSCPALPSYPHALASDFACPLTYARPS